MVNHKFFGAGRLKVGQRNNTETKYEQHLERLKQAGEIVRYDFEPEKFRLADNTFYTPDFRVMLPSGLIEFHEVKGSWKIFQDDAKVKIKVAAEMHPYVFKAFAPLKGGGWECKIY